MNIRVDYRMERQGEVVETSIYLLVNDDVYLDIYTDKRKMEKYINDLCSMLWQQCKRSGYKLTRVLKITEV